MLTFSLTMNLPLPHSHVSRHVWKRRFQFFASARTAFSGSKNAGFQIRRSEWRFFKTPFSRLRVPDGLKRGFLNAMRSYIHTTSMRMFCKGCYRLVFSYGRAKTIRIRHVWTRLFENGM